MPPEAFVPLFKDKLQFTHCSDMAVLKLQEGVSWQQCVVFFMIAVICFFKYTPPKTNMDTKNDGLEKVTPFKKSFLVSMLDFSGVMYIVCLY